MKAVNGQSPRKGHEAGQPLYAETQGRQMVAALVNEAVDEALGLAFAGASARQDRAAGEKKATKPSK